MANYAHPEVLVSTDWVVQHLADPKVKLTEVDVDTKSYDEGHVPNAIAWAWNTQLCDTVVRDIASKSAFEELLTQSGLEAGKQCNGRHWEISFERGFAQFELSSLKLFQT